jgi:hypothetical protein
MRGLDWPGFAWSGILIWTNGGETVSTEAVASRRHAGRHLPAIGWNITTANTQLALAA